MTVDPRYSKPGLSIHRTPARGSNKDWCDSPMTPLRTPQPSLGEVGELLMIDSNLEGGGDVHKMTSLLQL